MKKMHLLLVSFVFVALIGVSFGQQVCEDFTYATIDTTADVEEHAVLDTSIAGSSTPNMSAIQGLGLMAIDGGSSHYTLFGDIDVGTEAGGPVWSETFDLASLNTTANEDAVALDNSVDTDTEAVLTLDSGNNWGAYAGGDDAFLSGDHQSVWLRDIDTGIANTSLGFNRAVMDGALRGDPPRIYTNFDGSTVLDLSDAATSLTATLVSDPNEWVSLSVLLRDDAQWWASDPVTIATAGIKPWNAGTPPDLFSVILADLTWNPVVAGAATTDMDEMDNGGETGPLMTADNDNETPVTVDSGFTWGSYAGGPLVVAGVSNEETWLRDADTARGVPNLGFNRDVMKSPGSRIYTRFDQATTVDGTGGLLRLVVESKPNTGVEIAILLRDATGWFMSDPVALADTDRLFIWRPPDVAPSLTKDITLADVTWTPVDTAVSPAGQDVDEVDAGGEFGSLRVNPYDTATPDLSTIEGVGIQTVAMDQDNWLLFSEICINEAASAVEMWRQF